MAQSTYKTLPFIDCTVARTSHWQSLIAINDRRVYPYQLGAMVRVAGSANPMELHGQGDIAASDYIIACSADDYGGAPLYVPDTTRTGQLTAGGLSGTNDEITLASAITVEASEWIFTLGTVALGSSPYDSVLGPTAGSGGSSILLYNDPVGTTQNTDGFMRTSQGGWIRGWVSPDTRTVISLLITDPDATELLAVVPYYALGPKVSN